MSGKQYLKNQLSVILINLLGMLALALFLIANGNHIQIVLFILAAVSYTHLTLPTILRV